MKILSSLLVAASFLCLIGCAETAETDETTTTTSTTELDDIDDTELYDPNTSEPGTDMGQMSMDTAANNQATGNLNPAHGEPGHRCDIQVGAPLDSPPNQAVQPQMNIQQGQQQTTTSSTTKINPAHGEPGHDCSVAVGAPLN